MSQAKLKFVTDYINAGAKGHHNYSFVDVAVNSDNRLFIDPILLELGHSEWHRESHRVLQSYFDSLYRAYREDNNLEKKELLAHAREQNATRLGYGNGNNGKGNSPEGLLAKLSGLDSIVRAIPSMSKPGDVCVFLPNFAEDGLSDLITNVLLENLCEFTISQLCKFGMEPNTQAEFCVWNLEASKWLNISKPAFLIENQILLLVPKDVVRKRYLFSIGQYFNRIILERIRDEEKLYVEGRPISKSQIRKDKGYESQEIQRNVAFDYTKRSNNLLDEYHRKLPGFYRDNGGRMTDEELDLFLYKYDK